MFTEHRKFSRSMTSTKTVTWLARKMHRTTNRFWLKIFCLEQLSENQSATKCPLSSSMKSDTQNIAIENGFSKNSKTLEALFAYACLLILIEAHTRCQNKRAVRCGGSTYSFLSDKLRELRTHSRQALGDKDLRRRLFTSSKEVPPQTQCKQCVFVSQRTNNFTTRSERLVTVDT